ncbi:hypothetical protein M433DRAFT_157579 [Acidomyces richmondensis BFW]|nr:hypothetical protein M433DRAFT_161390 [Acidomyces richmondensis BFW]KYG42702.1 hypothetical protein M433DRAFT_157579 [Acidomyces richmondensis BFW]
MKYRNKNLKLSRTGLDIRVIIYERPPDTFANLITNEFSPKLIAHKNHCVYPSPNPLGERSQK